MLFVLLLVFGCVKDITQTNNSNTTNPTQNLTDLNQIWIPEKNSTFQWQLDGELDTTINATVYDIDLFDNNADDIENLHSKGKKVICYISAGSWENWRDDKDDFPLQIIGKNYDGWDGEKWLDIRRIDLLGPVITKRLDLAKEKGCDGIEPDNIDGYETETGFPITEYDQLEYNIWLANETHKRGMSIGLKNDAMQTTELVGYFDWALTEDCYAENWCEKVKIFSMNGKTVFQVEYTDQGTVLGDFCLESKKNEYVGILKNKELDAWRESCS
ncbi:MAG: endo alpha-1,4 polygalactosaminidase [Candidatus Micrarchaeota archaeon]